MDATVYQHGEEECGYAALRSFLILLTGREGWRYLPRPKEGPLDLERLSRMAAEAGVSLVWKKAHYKGALLENPRLPLLLLLEEGSRGHLIVLRKKKGDRFLVEDPAKGRSWVRAKDLLSSWNLVFGEGELLEKREPPRKRRLQDPFEMPLLLAMLTLELALLMPGLYFLQEDPRLFYAILFLSLSLFAHLLREGLSHYFLVRFDRRNLPLLRKGSPPEDFLLYQKAKSSLTRGPMHLLSSILVALVLYLYLALDSPGFALAGGIVLVLEGLYLPVAALLRKEERKLEEVELPLLRKPYEPGRGKKASMMAHALALKSRLLEALSYVPLLPLSFLALWGAKDGGFPLLVSSFLSLFLLARSFRPALRYPFYREERRRLLDAFHERFLSLPSRDW